MNESEKQFSFTRAAPSTSGRAKNQIPISTGLALIPEDEFDSPTEAEKYIETRPARFRFTILEEISGGQISSREMCKRKQAGPLRK